MEYVVCLSEQTSQYRTFKNEFGLQVRYVYAVIVSEMRRYLGTLSVLNKKLYYSPIYFQIFGLNKLKNLHEFVSIWI